LAGCVFFFQITPPGSFRWDFDGRSPSFLSPQYPLLPCGDVMTFISPLQCLPLIPFSHLPVLLLLRGVSFSPSHGFSFSYCRDHFVFAARFLLLGPLGRLLFFDDLKDLSTPFSSVAQRFRLPSLFLSDSTGSYGPS